MRSAVIAAAIAAFSFAAAAQQPPAVTADPVVATINGETLTKAKLDALYAAMPEQIRRQYDQAGGKRAFLDNYIAKRLLLQEAVKAGFDQREDVKAAPESARESLMFNRYVRDVIAPKIVPESAVRDLYVARADQLVAPERVKVRQIFLSLEDKRPEEVLAAAQKIFSELQAHRVTFHPESAGGREAFSKVFAEAARKYSDDPTAKDGGDLGWITRGQRDAKVEEVAFTMPAGIMSGIVGTDQGYYFILVEERKPAGVVPFEEVRHDLREALLVSKQREIMAEVGRVTAELRTRSNVVVYAAYVD